MADSLKNISLKKFRSFLLFKGLKHIRTNGDHEIWAAKHLNRPVVLQSNIDPVPEFIIRNNLRTMGLTSIDLLNFLNKD